MKSNRGYRWLVLVVLVILAGTLSAGMASARDYAGSCTLPFATQWGFATLPAGDYSIRIDTTQVPYVTRIYGKNVNIIVIAQAVADYPQHAEPARGPGSLPRGGVTRLQLWQASAQREGACPFR